MFNFLIRYAGNAFLERLGRTMPAEFLCTVAPCTGLLSYCFITVHSLPKSTLWSFDNYVIFVDVVPKLQMAQSRGNK